jgi:tRNA(His) guanylyltransferase
MYDKLGDRMKLFYEDSYRLTLPQRLPIIIRLDGKSFHEYTDNLKKPFDKQFSNVMSATATALFDMIQGAVLVYSQSDEISILVHNYKRLQSQSWFGNNLQKMVSIAAAQASVAFTTLSWQLWHRPGMNIYDCIKPALFDARAFVIPENEVCNYFVWRQQDCMRNSISGLARSLYSHKELLNKNSSQLQQMCFEKGLNWNDVETRFKRGFAVSAAGVDFDVPIFTQDRSYVEKHLQVDSEEKVIK